jgi:putative monooxygenase
VPVDPTTTVAPDQLRVDSADVTPTRRAGGAIRVLLSPRTVGSTSGFNATLTLAPGEYVSEQYHPYSDKYLYLVRGALTVRVAGRPVPLTADQAYFVPRDTPHRIENTGADTAFVVFAVSPLAPRPELGHVDTEPVPNPGEPLPHVGGATPTEPGSEGA